MIKRLTFFFVLIAVALVLAIPVYSSGTFDTRLGTTSQNAFKDGRLADHDELWTTLDTARDDIVALEGGSLGSDGNWNNTGTYLISDVSSEVFITNATGVLSVDGLDATVSDLTLSNDQMIIGSTNNSVILQENDDTLTIGFDGNDVNITASDGSIELVPETSDADGTIDFLAAGDTSDYVQIITTADRPAISFVGCNGTIVAGSGSIGFEDENLSTTGTLAAGATTVTGKMISDLAEVNGELVLANDEVIQNATDGTIALTSAGATILRVASGSNATNASVFIVADQDDDAADDWELRSVASDNDFHLINGTTLRLTVASSGEILTTADLTVGGTTPALTVGDAGAEDATIIFNGNVDDVVMGIDDTGGGAEDMFFLSTGTTTADIRFSLDTEATITHLTLGDGVNAEDKIITIDGNAVDFSIAYDDGTDDLIVSLGSVPGTTPAITIDGADASVGIGSIAGIDSGYDDAGDLYLAGDLEVTADLSLGSEMTITSTQICLSELTKSGNDLYFRGIKLTN